MPPLLDDTRTRACGVGERAEPINRFVLPDDGLLHFFGNLLEILVVSPVHATTLSERDLPRKRLTPKERAQRAAASFQVPPIIPKQNENA